MFQRVRRSQVVEAIRRRPRSLRVRRRSSTVAGAIILVIVLLAFPILVGLGAVVIAAILGESLHRDARVRNETSELLELNT